MQEKTKADYRKLAAHFYKTRLDGETPTPKKISDALKASAADYRPAYWRKLRNALAFDQTEKGYSDAAARVNSTVNPATKEGSKIEVKPKQKRIRKVDEADEEKLLETLAKSEDFEAYAAVIATKISGARPAELAEMYEKDGIIYIKGAKQSHHGARGADRALKLSDGQLSAVKAALPHLGGDVGPVQDRIRAAGKRLWPQRKALPTLYSWRHQLGSELKASGMDRKAMAYVMGHQSTASIDQYGNRKMARGGSALPEPAEAVENVRELHSEPPAREPERAPEPIEEPTKSERRQSKHARHGMGDGPSFGQ